MFAQGGRTESRLDVPADHSQVRSSFIVAGVAWASTRGISRVEVSSDDGRSWNSVTGERITLCKGILAISRLLLKGVKEGGVPESYF